jgi:hypothetical protein
MDGAGDAVDRMCRLALSLILLVLLLRPAQVAPPVPKPEGGVSVGLLDICHSPLTSNVDMSVIPECPCTMGRLTVMDDDRVVQLLRFVSAIILPEEHPPRHNDRSASAGKETEVRQNS